MYVSLEETRNKLITNITANYKGNCSIYSLDIHCTCTCECDKPNNKTY